MSDIDLDEEWVAKPLGPSEFRDPDNERMLVFTSPLPDDASWDGWTLLRGAPFIVQRRIHAEAHFRIVTVRDRAWVSVLRDTSELDWRRSEAAHGAFTASDTDYDVADMQRSALRIADSAQVGFSSQDWIWDGKQSWFVDLNPAGQWLFLPGPIADDVTVAIAGWLAARSTT